MNLFTRYHLHRVESSVILPLFLFLLLPYVTCQQESGSANPNVQTDFSTESIIAIVVLAIFITLSMVSCCLHCTFYRAETEAAVQEVLHNRARRGLEKEVIESFPTFLYSEVKGLKIGKGGVECAICLSEFEDEESLRWMPPCSHTFHANCIDVWLSSRSTCPVCRANLSLKPGESFPYPNMDVETGNAQRGIQEPSTEISLADYTTPRSRSTGLLSNWRMAEIFVPRSHSTGHSLVQLGENLDRFTLQLPEEVQRQLVSLKLIRRSHMALPQAMSSRQGYRSGSVGSERGSFSQGRQTHRRALSMSLSFSFQTASVLSTHDRNDQVRETSQAKDKYFGERSFERLMPEKV
ncbi:Zinc finger RING-type [Arabidopsis thaliana x Arabidopsis arenosa]|uniref:RING-type E3 ubiquitin transferase n=1 Tax=Arabidopsis thaliana x Arabidopsis arenosa TaxID=1240361 RepID=A0A8T1Z0V3_9BRAS|nr:Zinc finger RING-type [Arabidopsis thaliana x Arabidopsis arenosa]